MRKVVLSLLISVAVSSACTATGSPQKLGAPAPAEPAKTSASVTELDNDAFCQAARQAGVTNTALSEDADPVTLLPAIDALTKIAPASIHDDFVTFDRVEHALLDPAGGDGAGLDQPSTRTAMAHVADYLDNTCHISS
jgi:hypothetical protein